MRDYAELWENAPSGQLLLDDDGLVTAVNTTFTSWTGHTADALLGTPFPQLLPIGDRVLYTTHSLPQLVVTGRIAEASVQVNGADGRRHEDVAWTYPDPLPDAVPVTGHWSFLGEGVETEVDGKPLPTGA